MQNVYCMGVLTMTLVSSAESMDINDDVDFNVLFTCYKREMESTISFNLFCSDLTSLLVGLICFFIHYDMYFISK